MNWLAAAISGCASKQNLNLKGYKMKKVAIIGANGKSGSALVAEALR